jgi:hypothetical protein
MPVAQMVMLIIARRSRRWKSAAAYKEAMLRGAAIA